jgi:hypothetical protein
MLVLSLHALPLVFALAVFQAPQATGVLNLRVKDVETGYALRAKITLEGPQTLTAETDDTGWLRITLPVGQYRIEASAPGYELMRTHDEIAAVSGGMHGLMMHPENPPDEERPEVIDAKTRPGFTLLHGFIVDGETGRPLPGVKVRLENARVETTSNDRGYYELSVATPKPATPDGIGTDTLIYEKAGYVTHILENFGIIEPDLAIGGDGVDLERGTRVIREDATHPLLRPESPKTQEPQRATPGSSISPELYRWLGTPGTPFRADYEAPTPTSPPPLPTKASPSSKARFR